jgi:hypothetical protein
MPGIYQVYTASRNLHGIYVVYTDYIPRRGSRWERQAEQLERRGCIRRGWETPTVTLATSATGDTGPSPHQGWTVKLLGIPEGQPYRSWVATSLDTIRVMML